MRDDSVCSFSVKSREIRENLSTPDIIVRETMLSHVIIIHTYMQSFQRYNVIGFEGMRQGLSPLHDSAENCGM